VPDYLVLGATGVEVDRSENADGTVTHRYHQADVHDFAWTVSPNYIEQTAMFTEPGLPPVRLRLLLQPEHQADAENYFDSSRACLKYFGEWFGAYPYEQLTIIDPPLNTNTGGMEYPTLFTGASRLFSPAEGHSPEGVTIHECGHQFWYAMVGSNEFENAWMDEGLTSFSADRTMDVAYGDRSWVERYLPLPGASGALPMVLDGITQPRVAGRLDLYRSGAISDDQETLTYLYYAPTAHRTTYSKTMLWLGTLERYLGWETLQQAMATYFERYRFAHPRPEDFFATLEEVSGQELDWYIDQVFRSTVTFDYAVVRVESYSAETTGLVEQDGELAYHEADADDDEGPYRTDVVVRRLGDGRFPVDVLMVFEDGHEIRHSWDGETHWKAFTVEYPEKLDYAVIDPERILMLDLYPNNNSMLRDPEPAPASQKWSAYWMIWVQDLLNTFSFFV
jgi:aminopeptidase N